MIFGSSRKPDPLDPQNIKKNKVLELSTSIFNEGKVACPMDLSSNMTPENQWLKDDNCLLGWPIFEKLC